MVKSYVIKFTILTIFSLEFSSINHIHIALQKISSCQTGAGKAGYPHQKNEVGPLPYTTFKKLTDSELKT